MAKRNYSGKGCRHYAAGLVTAITSAACALGMGIQASRAGDESGLAATAGYSTTGAGKAGVSLSGENYFATPEVLFGNESGLGIGLGRNDDIFDVNATYERAGDNSEIVLGARLKPDWRWLSDVSGDLYAQDVRGVSGQARIPLNGENRDIFGLDLDIGGFSLKGNGKASGVYADLVASWRFKYADIALKAGYISDDKLTGENFFGGIGIGIPGGRNNGRIDYFGINELNSDEGILGAKPQAATSRTTGAGTQGNGNGGDGEYHGPEPGPAIYPETPATPPAEGGPIIPPETPATP